MHSKEYKELASCERVLRRPGRAAPAARLGGRLGRRTGKDERPEIRSSFQVPRIIDPVRRAEEEHGGRELEDGHHSPAGPGKIPSHQSGSLSGDTPKGRIFVDRARKSDPPSDGRYPRVVGVTTSLWEKIIPLPLLF